MGKNCSLGLMDHGSDELELEVLAPPKKRSFWYGS